MKAVCLHAYIYVSLIGNTPFDRSSNQASWLHTALALWRISCCQGQLNSNSLTYEILTDIKLLSKNSKGHCWFPDWQAWSKTTCVGYPKRTPLKKVSYDCKFLLNFILVGYPNHKYVVVEPAVLSWMPKSWKEG